MEAFFDSCVVCRYLYKRPSNPALQASGVMKYLHQSKGTGEICKKLLGLIWHPLLSVMDPSWNNSNFFQRLTTHQKGRGSPYQGGEDCHQPESKILPQDKKAVSPVQEGTEGNLLSRRSFSLIEYPYNVSDNHKSTMKE